MSPAQLLLGLSQLQRQGFLCDAELQVEGRIFRAHKAVLAAASPYFSAMYTTVRFLESGQVPTNLQVSSVKSAHKQIGKIIKKIFGCSQNIQPGVEAKRLNYHP